MAWPKKLVGAVPWVWPPVFPKKELLEGRLGALKKLVLLGAF